MKDWSPEKFMNVYAVKVSDEDGFLSRDLGRMSLNRSWRQRLCAFSHPINPIHRHQEHKNHQCNTAHILSPFMAETGSK